MKKILFITPHLSTGGLPQYLLKQIETFKNELKIYCIEWENITGNILIVQRSKIEKILGKNLISLGNEKEEVIKIINEINPDIIHFQEIPETFISEKIINSIYSAERNYRIVVTTHSSHTDPSRLKYTADKFVLVSNWSRNKFENYFKNSIPCDKWEYPIERNKYDKIEAKKELGFDLNTKHVLHVGLFTPGKNQNHIIEVARKCLNYDIKFHFVGNQSNNFKDYWDPIMKNLPNNCIWHNERVDVEKYYKASDLFFFPSLYELSPLSIKEAISYNLPLFLTKLETYETDYDGIATYINDNVDESVSKLLNHFSLKKENEIPFLHILTDIDSDREIKSIQSLTKMDKFNCKYIPIVSKRYTDRPPAETCQYPEKIDMEPGGKLTPAHYGCYLGHRKAFETGIKLNTEHIMIFECDAALDVTHEEFYEKIKFAIKKMNDDNLLMFSFGYHNNTDILEKKDGYWVVNRFYGAHAYLIPKKSYEIISKTYNKHKWNVADLFFAENLSDYRIGIFPTPPTKQIGGYSILDKTYNNDRY